jgi:hypothetical protein
LAQSKPGEAVCYLSAFESKADPGRRLSYRYFKSARPRRRRKRATNWARVRIPGAALFLAV